MRTAANGARGGSIAALGSVVLAFAVAAGCGGNAQVAGSGGAPAGPGTGAGVITGAGGGHTTTGSGATGGSGSGTTTQTPTGTSTGEEKLGAPYPVVLCHGFFGFEEFAGVDALPYFFNVPERLAEDGEYLVFTPAVDPFNSSDFRADQLAAIIDDIVQETGHEKVILIGHSQGGLDARAVASLRPDLVAAVVTVATPHQGSGVADIALGLTENPQAAGVIDDLVKLLAGPLYDAVGDETSIAKALHLFTAPGIEEFNQKYPDQQDVFYASITGRTDWSLGGQACAADVELPWVSELKGDKDPCDVLFVAFEGILDGKLGEDIPNDGLVQVESAKWGEFWGCLPADHMDEVGQLMGDDPGLSNGFDHEEMFSQIVKELRKRGY